MKKILLSILMVFLISMVGCSADTAGQPSEEGVNSNEATLLKGRIVTYGIPLGDGILLDEKIIVDGREVEEVFFDDSILLSYIPREYMANDVEGNPMLKEELNGQIEIRVTVDPDSYDYYEELNRTSVKIVEIISIDNVTNPEIQSQETYTENELSTENQSSFNGTFDIANLRNGDQITDEMFIDNIQYKKGSDQVSFSLKGETMVFGTLMFSDYAGGYIISVQDPYLFTSKIQITLANTYTFDYQPGFLYIRNDNFIPDSYKQAIQEGKTVQCKATVQDIDFLAIYESEGGESCQILGFIDVSIVD